MEELVILQHNALNWKTRSHELMNIYNKTNPEVILLNSTCLKQNERLKMFNYNTYQRNIKDELHAGIAIAIRKDIKHRILDDTTDDLLAVELDTTRGPVVICTLYIPPRRSLLPVQDLMKFIRQNKPVYVIGDINANHTSLGNNTCNTRGRAINNLIQRNLVYHIGPNFDTWFHTTRTGRPDIVLANQNIHHNITITEEPITTSVIYL